MTKTASDITTGALRKLAVVASDETPDANDANTALAEYASFHARLQRLFNRTCTWDSGSVPDEVAPLIESMLAMDLIGSFAVDQETMERIQVAAQKADRDFRQYQTRKPRYVVQMQIV